MIACASYLFAGSVAVLPGTSRIVRRNCGERSALPWCQRPVGRTQPRGVPRPHWFPVSATSAGFCPEGYFPSSESPTGPCRGRILGDKGQFPFDQNEARPSRSQWRIWPC